MKQFNKILKLINLELLTHYPNIFIHSHPFHPALSIQLLTLFFFCDCKNTRPFNSIKTATNQLILSSWRFIQIQKMLQILLLLGLLILYSYYTLWVKPQQLIRYYKKTYEQLGYKVETLPYILLGSAKRNKHIIDERKYNDSYYSYKHSKTLPDITLYNVFNRVAIDIGNVELIKEFYLPDNFVLYPKYEPFVANLKRTLGQGILLSEGNTWKAKRKLMNKVFNYSFITASIPKIKTICNQTLDEYEKESLKEGNKSFVKFPCKQIFSIMFAKIVLAIFFGEESYNCYIEGMPACLFVAKLNKNVLAQAASIRGLLFGVQSFKWGLTAFDRSINERLLILNNFAKDHIEKRIKQIRSKQKEPNESTDIIQAIFLQNNPELKAFDSKSIQGIIEEFNTFYQAATDTSQHFMQMLLVYLCQYPQVQQKIREQLSQYINSEQDITAQNLKKLHYLDCVQKETTRTYGPATGIMVRVASKDNYLKDIPVKKGTCLTQTIMGIHYSSQFYKNPTQFRPERWEGQCDKNPPFSLLGFGAGPRACIGKYFAMLQTKITLVKMLLRYKSFSIPEKQVKMRISFMYEPVVSEFIAKKNQEE